MTQDFSKWIAQALEIRKTYHSLERAHHKTEWTLEEDALAFLTDAGLVGRLIMSHEGRWPTEDTPAQLRHKLGECMWWLMVLSDRAGLDAGELLKDFLDKTADKMK